MEFSQQVLENYFNFNIHDNPLSGSRVLPCVRNRRADGQTDVTKLINAFRNFVNPQKKS